ncbi:Isoprenyl transferase [subsurface metagenome]
METDLPQHLAIIPDGNRRWSKLHGVPALEGHRRGAEAMHNVVEYLNGHRVKCLTLWGFSTDNWKRSQDEVSSLFQLLAVWIDKDSLWAHSQGIRLRHLGRLHELPEALREAITRAVTLTQNNSGMTFNIAFNYTGRAEIVDAVNRLLDENAQHIDEEVFNRYLYTDRMPDVDLVIRTAGEFRLSNFMLWQTAYSEYYFTDTLWPDFSVEELEKALQVYSERLRPFGGD